MYKPEYPHTSICRNFLDHFPLLTVNLYILGIDKQYIFPTFPEWLTYLVLVHPCPSVIGLLFVYVFA